MEGQAEVEKENLLYRKLKEKGEGSPNNKGKGDARGI